MMIDYPIFGACATCAATPGSPRLCDACRYNRDHTYREQKRQQAEVEIIAQRAAEIKRLLGEAFQLSDVFLYSWQDHLALTERGHDHLACVRLALQTALTTVKHLDVQRDHDEARAAAASA